MRPRRGTVQAPDQVQKRRLPRPRFPQQCDSLAPPHLQRDPPQREDRGRRGAVALHDVFDPNRQSPRRDDNPPNQASTPPSHPDVRETGLQRHLSQETTGGDRLQAGRVPDIEASWSCSGLDREAMPQDLATISGVMSMPMTLPFRLIFLAANSVSKPAPQPRSRIVCPGSGSPRENGLPTSQDESVTPNGKASPSGRVWRAASFLRHVRTDLALPLLARCNGYSAKAMDNRYTKVPWLFGLRWHGSTIIRDARSIHPKVRMI